MAKQIRMVFGVNTPGGVHGTLLDGGPDPLTERGRKVGKNFANCGPTTNLKNG